MIKATNIHSGQYKRYGDFFRVWDIESDEPKEAVLAYCFKEIYKRDPILPTEAEWRKNIRIGGSQSGNASYYFRGYYTLKSAGGSYEGEITKYTFTVCEPYAD